MIYILFSICCSVTVAVLLKLARRYKINVIQAVTWNYLFAVLLGVLLFKPQVKDILTIPAPVYLVLGILLPVIFWVLAASIKNIGIVKTDISQRLSLFIPILASFFIYKEQIGGLKLAGLIVGILAILLTLMKKHAQKSSEQVSSWLFPIIVFIGFGIIDISFKKVAQIKAIPFTTGLLVIFGLSFLVSVLSLIYLRVVKKQKLELVNLFCGGILGLFNFGNIYFYLKAHQVLSQSPSLVFTAMNMGVIIFGSLIGIVLFKEKFEKINYIGLLLALASILLITQTIPHAV